MEEIFELNVEIIVWVWGHDISLHQTIIRNDKPVNLLSCPEG